MDLAQGSTLSPRTSRPHHKRLPQNQGSTRRLRVRSSLFMAAMSTSRILASIWSFCKLCRMTCEPRWSSNTRGSRTDTDAPQRLQLLNRRHKSVQNFWTLCRPKYVSR